MINIGSNIGIYTLKKELGSGFFGITYLAYDELNEREVALKIIHNKRDFNIDELRNEVNNLKGFKHKNIIGYYDCNKDTKHNVYFIAMEYAPFGNLRDIIHKCKLDRSIRIAIRILQGLEVIHRDNIFHSDLKPENIFIGEKGTIKIGDFGVSKKSNMTHIYGNAAGTLLYCAPEQFSKNKTSIRTDIWSVGVILYELIYKQRPFNEISQIIYPSYSPSFKNNNELSIVNSIIKKCLAFDEYKRYKNASELIKNLQKARKTCSVGEGFQNSKVFQRAYERNKDSLEVPIGKVQEKYIGEIEYYKQEFYGIYPECYYAIYYEKGAKEAYCIRHGIGSYIYKNKIEKDLGVPTCDEYYVISSTGVKSALQLFHIGYKGWQNRRLYFHLDGKLSYQSFYTRCGINEIYESIGSEQSHLGLPVSNEDITDFGAVSNFERGKIEWYKNTGEIKTYYY